MSALVLVRHAPTAYNAAKRLQGRLDVPLDDAGRERAAWAAGRIVAEFGPGMRVLTSPLSRARDTADVLAEHAGGRAEVDDALTQRSYGVWEGLTWAEVGQRWPEEVERRRGGLDPRIDGWEGQAEVYERVGTALRLAWDDARAVAVVSHGSTIALGLLSLLGIDPTSQVLGRVPHTSWTVVRPVESGAWHIEAFALGAD